MVPSRATIVSRESTRGLAVALVCALLSCTAGGNPTEEVAQTAAAVSLSIALNKEIGHLVSGGNGLARSYHSYDALGREAASQHVLDGSSYVYSMAYGYPQSAVSESGLGTVVKSVTFPDSEVVVYTYDAGGAPQTISTTPSGGTEQTIVSKQVRNARGQTTEVDYGDGLKQVHCYDDTTDLRLNAIKTGTWSGTPSCTTAATSLVQSYSYTFDGSADVTAVDDYCTAALPGVCCDPAGGSCAAQAMSASYAYDSLGELTTATSNGTTNYYSYDNTGDLTCMQGTAVGCGNQSYPTQGAGSVRPHAVSSSTASGSRVTFGYDANGNTTSTSAGLAITWSADNMATEVVSGSTTVNEKWFVGERLWKKVEGTATTHYLPSLRNEGGGYRKYFASFAERDWTDTTSCTVNASKGCLKFYHSDHLGSSAVATTSTGAVVYRHAYWPYGGDRSLLGTFAPKYQFNFKEKEASGFYDYGARLYDSVTGRFISVDSDVGQAAYAYANNSPLQYTDPTGHSPKHWVWDWFWETADRVAASHPDSELAYAEGVISADVHPIRTAERTFNTVGEAGLAVALAAMGQLNWQDPNERQAFYNGMTMYAAQGIASGMTAESSSIPKTIPTPDVDIYHGTSTALFPGVKVGDTVVVTPQGGGVAPLNPDNGGEQGLVFGTTGKSSGGVYSEIRSIQSGGSPVVIRFSGSRFWPARIMVDNPDIGALNPKAFVARGPITGTVIHVEGQVPPPIETTSSPIPNTLEER